MNELAGLLANPAAKTILKVVLIYFAFSAAVDALPNPDQFKNPVLRWTLGTLHGFAGNLKRAAKAVKVPGADS